MKTVAIGRSFTGYPNGKRREFTEGDRPELANDYADLVVGKGLAREVTTPAKPGKDRAGEPVETDPETAE